MMSLHCASDMFNLNVSIFVSAQPMILVYYIHPYMTYICTIYCGYIINLYCHLLICIVTRIKQLSKMLMSAFLINYAA